MKLRKLEPKDAQRMLSWMHDAGVVEFMQANFASMQESDCLRFIERAQDESRNLHLAVADENDRYMGTVSLKNITQEDAEFAITVCAEAMGKGFSQFAMQEIIRIGLEERNLKTVYWYVDPANKRAVRFYDKNGYQRMTAEEVGTLNQNMEFHDGEYVWYKMERDV